MLSYYFADLTLLIFFCLLVTILWFIYYTHVNNITTPAVLSTDTKRKKIIDINGNVFIVIFNLLCIWLWLTNYIYIQNTWIHIILWDSVHISNNTLSYFYMLIVILLIILLSSTCLFNQNISFTVEYLIFVILIGFFGFLLSSSTNLFLTIFLLELVALLIFGKFAVSRILFNKNPIDLNKSTNIPQFSYGLFNSLFFQFWANFVSSIFLFFSLINIHYAFGTSNLFFINLFCSILNHTNYLPEIFITFSLAVLTTGLFIKFGLSPYQFFKIETYKGIPLYMIVVYTTLYLVIYIYFFSYLYINQIPNIKNFIGVFVIIFISISMFYLVSLLFDTKNFKAFLSYSTLITIINIFIIVLIL